MFHFCKYVLAAFLALAAAGQATAQNGAWRDTYKVKKKDTVYSIAKSYGITIDELERANPEMKAEGYVLKKGDTLFIPAPGASKTSAAGFSGLKSKDRINVGVMLPLHTVDGDGRRMAEYYRGLLIACDSLRSEGLNVDVHAWNVNIDADIRSTLLDSAVGSLDIIFGPLYTKQVGPLADYCRSHDIKLVIPFSTTADDVNTNDHVYQVYQSAATLNDRAAEAFVTRFGDCQAVFVSCNDKEGDRSGFVTALAARLRSKGIPFKTVGLDCSDVDFTAAFSETKNNVVVLDTSRSPQLNLVFRRLNDLSLTAPSIRVSMFGYVEWLMYESAYRSLFNKYDAYIPSTFYYYRGLRRVADFERNYNRWFGETMQEQYIPRFALTGFDHGQFFLRGLRASGKAFTGEEGASSYKPMQTPLKFQRTREGGGMRNGAFQLVHYRRSGVVETIPF